jgi:hypothetical protein
LRRLSLAGNQLDADTMKLQKMDAVEAIGEEGEEED